MPRPPLPPEQRRTSRSIRLTAAQWAALDAAAREAHTSAAGLVRDALAALLGKRWPLGDE